MDPRFANLASRSVSSLLLVALMFAAVGVAPAFAAPGDCDGTPGNDNITCSFNPTNPDSDIDLEDGNDTLIVGTGITTGDINGGSGNDHITLNGSADSHPSSSVAGDNYGGGGGNDIIIVNGFVNDGVYGDLVVGLGGNDTITITGTVIGEVQGDNTFNSGGNDIIWVSLTGTVGGVKGDSAASDGGADTITIDGHVTGTVMGDYVDRGDGGNDTITINGTVGGDVLGDYSDGGSGGNDTITINGTVGGDVLGDHVDDSGGNDTVILGVNAVVNGTIDGEGGTDTLGFKALTQAELDAMGLNPASDTATINGHTYTWLNFEKLLGLFQELVEQAQEAVHELRVFFVSGSLAAVESMDGDGINIFAKPGRIAFVSFESLEDLDTGESVSYHTPHSAGWYAVVTCLGADADHAGRSLYHVQVFAAGGASIGQFTFSN